MNKKQQIEEIRHILENYIDYMKDECDKCIAACGKYNDTCMAYALYNAGYRKTFTSDFASDTQKAYKEGYIKGIEETVEKPVDTQKKQYESIDDIVRGFVVKDGKILYVTNILDGCRHEFNDIYEICDELNNNMKEIDRLMELNNHLRFQLDELKGDKND